MQKKSDFKLPQIKKTHKQSSTLLSKTISDSNYTPKVRPASSNKVEDLEKKLFNKLEAYDQGSKKKLTKKIAKIDKQSTIEHISMGESIQAYAHLQKLKPGLYSKFVETKKGNYMSENLISEFQGVSLQGSIPSIIKKESFQITRPQSKPQIIGIQADSKEEELYSEEEMNKIFREYQAIEGLPTQTTNKEMKQLNQSILVCENNIEQIRKSMQGLIHEIGMEYINQIQKDYQFDFSK